MFKFNFGNLEDEDDAAITSKVPQNQHGKVAVQDPAVEKPIQELTTDELVCMQIARFSGSGSLTAYSFARKDRCKTFLPYYPTLS